MGAPSFLHDQGLKLLFFGGKGGVGKTTCATATALRLAGSNTRAPFLLVSTDPAHSLMDSMAGFPPPGNLEILELNAGERLAAFKKKHNRKLREIAARGTFLDNDDINQFLELSMPGTDELMAFLEITGWVEDQRYDCIIVDTAPTGHTLRLLALPDLIRKWLEALDALLAKHRYMKKLFSGSYCRDELDAFLTGFSDSLKQMIELLRDPYRCRFVPALLAEELSIRETIKLIAELERMKISVTDIVVNRLYPENACPVCTDARKVQMGQLENLFNNSTLSRRAIWGAPIYPEEVCGPGLLDAFLEGVTEITGVEPISREERPGPYPIVEAPPDCPSPATTLLVFAGKGGVGKTTMACATALRLAQELAGTEIFLFSTDPAHSLADCLDTKIGRKPTRLFNGLTAMEIDAQAEFESLKTRYSEELEKFLETIASNLDLTFDREVMERILDLAPPGLDEVMALTKAMEFLGRGDYDILILDSAPTGHLVRLLEMPELIDRWLKVFFNLFLKYKRVFRLPGISKRLVQMSKDLKRLRSLLKDPNRSAVYAVTIPTEMAFQESKDLVAACARMGVNVPVIFQNLATPESDCPLCSALFQRESQVGVKFLKAFPDRHQTLVYRLAEPRGMERLRGLGDVLYRPIAHAASGLNRK